MATVAHKAIRPSNLHRRERCPGSLNAEMAIPEYLTIGTMKNGVDVATRGNELHSIIAAGIKTPANRINLLSESPDPEGVEIIQACFKEAQTCWDSLTDEQRGRAMVIVEKPVDLSFIPEMDEGTPDFAIVVKGTDTESGFIILRDWKSGGGWVPPARGNLQLLSYAAALAIQHDIDGWAEIGVFQPVVREYADTWKATREDLNSIVERIKRVVVHNKQENAPIIPGGHCQYCRARKSCEGRLMVAAEVKQVADPVSTISALAPNARAEFYQKLKAGIKMLDDAKKTIEGGVINGKFEIPGYIKGEGRKTRIWNDPESIITILTLHATKRGMSSQDVVAPISVAAAEKLLGKDAVKNLVLIKEENPTIKKEKKK